jgi:hypothetical protein
MDETSDQVQVLAARQVPVHGCVLPREADPAPHRLRVADDVEAQHLRPALVRPEDGRKDANRGRLPGAVRAEQAEDVSCRYLEVDAREGVHVAEALDEAVDGDRRAAHVQTGARCDVSGGSDVRRDG